MVRLQYSAPLARIIDLLLVKLTKDEATAVRLNVFETYIEVELHLVNFLDCYQKITKIFSWEIFSDPHGTENFLFQNSDEICWDLESIIDMIVNDIKKEINAFCNPKH